MSKTNKSSYSRKDALAVKIANFIEYGRKEIATKKELEKFPIGSLISYTNYKGNFKLGGFIIKFADDYFIYIAPDFTTKYRVRYKNVIKMWAGDVYTVINDIVSFTGTTQKKTKFPVELNNVIVYYGISNYDVKRFKCTERFKYMIGWYNYFVTDD